MEIRCPTCHQWHRARKQRVIKHNKHRKICDKEIHTFDLADALLMNKIPYASRIEDEPKIYIPDIQKISEIKHIKVSPIDGELLCENCGVKKPMGVCKDQGYAQALIHHFLLFQSEHWDCKPIMGERV